MQGCYMPFALPCDRHTYRAGSRACGAAYHVYTALSATQFKAWRCQRGSEPSGSQRSCQRCAVWAMSQCAAPPHTKVSWKVQSCSVLGMFVVARHYGEKLCMLGMMGSDVGAKVVRVCYLLSGKGCKVMPCGRGR